MADAEQWRSKAQDGIDKNGDIADIMEVELRLGELPVGNENGNLQKDAHQLEQGEVNRHSEISSSDVQEETHVSIISSGQVQCNTYATGITSIQNEKSLSDALILKSFQRMACYTGGGDHGWFQEEFVRSTRRDDSTTLNAKIAEENFVPEWTIANKDTVVAPDLAKMFVYKVSTPTDYSRYRSMGDSDFSDLTMVNQAESNFITSELHRRWVEAVVKMNKLELEHKNEIEMLRNQWVVSTETTTEFNQKQTKTYAELAADNARLVAAERGWQEKVDKLCKSMNDIQAKSNHAVEQHLKVVRSLQDTVTTLEQQKLWLLTTGVQHLSHKIRTSPEMVSAVAAVSKATNLCGFVVGIQAGYHYALEAKITMECVPDFPQNVDQNLKLAVSEFDNLLVPFVTILAAHVESPFEEIQALLQAPTPTPKA